MAKNHDVGERYLNRDRFPAVGGYRNESLTFLDRAQTQFEEANAWLAAEWIWTTKVQSRKE